MKINFKIALDKSDYLLYLCSIKLQCYEKEKRRKYT